eukprot:scaffold754_cov248-Pinguiococcus_pyrenoidosus.AAC.9
MAGASSADAKFAACVALKVAFWRLFGLRVKIEAVRHGWRPWSAQRNNRSPRKAEGSNGRRTSCSALSQSRTPLVALHTRGLSRTFRTGFEVQSALKVALRRAKRRSAAGAPRVRLESWTSVAETLEVWVTAKQAKLAMTNRDREGVARWPIALQR